MILKNYQNRVLRELSDYLQLYRNTPTLEKAFAAHWHRQGIGMGMGGMRPYRDTITGVPHVCIKVPTGGGKTVLGCAALPLLFNGLQQLKSRVAVWLVPSSAILQQTLRDFRNPQHPYRQELNFAFSGRVEIYDIEQALQGQNLSPETVRENISIFVMSYDTLRIRSKEGRRFYRANGNLAQFVPTYEHRPALIPQVDDTALAQVLNQHTPVVVVDESHNAQGELSVEMLKNLNPAVVLDMTATPRQNSNIISIVSASELKQENMVKLPVIVYNRPQKENVVADALLLRNNLERLALAQQQQGGDYIRPIVLFQAQPKTGEEAATFEKLRAQLIAAGVPAEHIAIKTAEVDELKQVDLLSPACPIRHIITVNALKEGWDCSFAYVLATVANRTSTVDVEQIVGRILRLPYARNHAHMMLNMSYVVTSSNQFRTTLEKVVAGLNKAGFSDKDYRAVDASPDDPQQGVSTPAPAQTTLLPETQPDADDVVFDPSMVSDLLTANNNRSDDIADTPMDDMTQAALQQGQAFEQQLNKATEEGLSNTGGDDLRKYSLMTTAFSHDVEGLKLPMFVAEEPFGLLDENLTLVSKAYLGEGFNLSSEAAHIDFTPSQSDVAELDIATSEGLGVVPINQRRATQLKSVILSEAPANRRKASEHLIYQYVSGMNDIPDSHLKGYISRVMDAMTPEQYEQMQTNLPNYANAIKKKILAHHDAYRERRFFSLIETGDIKLDMRYEFPKRIALVHKLSPRIGKALYTDEENVNDFEHKVIMGIAQLPNVVWWHRNLLKPGFVLNGFVNHYPDFIVMTSSGTIVLVEAKGDDRDNSDSRQKLKLGNKWKELAGQKYRYYMVYDENDTGEPGSYTLSKFLNLLSNL